MYIKDYAGLQIEATDNRETKTAKHSKRSFSFIYQ